MTKKQQFKWWVYIVGGLILILFVVPALLSARDTIAVISGLILLVVLGVISWRLWVKGAIQSIKGKLGEG